MIYRIKSTVAFRKGYKLAQKRGYNMSLLDAVVDRIAAGETLEERFHDHALSGEFKGLRECHIKPDWLLIYLIEDDILTLTLVKTGTHANLFGK